MKGNLIVFESFLAVSQSTTQTILFLAYVLFALSVVELLGALVADSAERRQDFFIRFLCKAAFAYILYGYALSWVFS